MIDPELIQLCADPRLEVEIVQQFVSEMNASDHLTIHVSQGNRTILVPKPETIEQAVETTQEWVGQANVRVGLTQYPAGLGITDPSQISHELFDSCENLRLGTELFGKVLRIVTQWYGGPAEPAFDDAIYAYRTGWFEGERVFYADDPGDVEVATPSRSTTPVETEVGGSPAQAEAGPSEPPFSDQDPNAASIRIDLSGIRAHNQEPASNQ
ncbi:conjugal transfer protein TraH [Mesorhizobium sp. YIM 152430]|uniref:conjugal transfer protein TraH n=1 Tax=Mesorhizobium sp. YIM 152430 TaxID=3031761 RepID=UPI0023DBB19F|nr:conjugal transfer protein TraH [Mesorhizobium sp. YIM 152430]MDF1600346.1 conjugal transfer protein TraH [Mesorhizobium sp. YIM 152430]